MTNNQPLRKFLCQLHLEEEIEAQSEEGAFNEFEHRYSIIGNKSDDAYNSLTIQAIEEEHETFNN